MVVEDGFAVLTERLGELPFGVSAGFPSKENSVANCIMLEEEISWLEWAASHLGGLIVVMVVS